MFNIICFPTRSIEQSFSACDMSISGCSKRELSPVKGSVSLIEFLSTVVRGKDALHVPSHCAVSVEALAHSHKPAVLIKEPPSDPHASTQSTELKHCPRKSLNSMLLQRLNVSGWHGSVPSDTPEISKWWS